MFGFATEPEDVRYFLRPGDMGEWVILDQEHGGAVVLHCDDAIGAEVIAALMNGDLAALTKATPEALARCRAAIGGALRILRPRGRPAIGAAAFPQV